MLNHFLAGIVGFGGLSLFLSGFFFPEVRRKPDFAWSGVALLYALVLWIEGDHTSGGALLGHIASVALILWFGWQALAQRRQFSPTANQTAIPGSLTTLTPFLKEGWGRIMVAYGETVAWVQDQLGKEDVGTLPKIQTPLAPQQDASDEDWENSDASSNSPSTESFSTATSEPAPIAAVEEEEKAAIAPFEVQVETLSADEDLPSEPELELDQSHEKPETSPTPNPIQPEEISSPVTLDQQATSDIEYPATPTAIEPTTTAIVEVSHDPPEEALLAESIAPSDMEKNSLDTTEEPDESVHPSTLENDDESWPPKESMT